MANKYFTEMRAACKAAVDMTANYLEEVEKYRPFPTVRPGFLVAQLPADPPQDGVSMETIFGDVDKLLLPGVGYLLSFFIAALNRHRAEDDLN